MIPSPSAPTPVPQRLMSVDALRGFDMFWIIGADALGRALARIEPNPVTRFVGTQLEHVEWGGLNFYDLIYPLFLFIVGVSIVLSLDRSLARETKPAILRRILRRGLVLYALGLVYNGGLSLRWPEVRLSGVLALIAVCYVIAATLYCLFAQRLKILLGITVALLVGYWAIFALVPFPDFRLDRSTVAELAARVGSTSPAAISSAVTQRVAGIYEEGHNLSNWIDYRFMPGMKYHGNYYDNQGLMSPFSAVTICLGGIFAARLLQSSLAARRKAKWLALAGLGALALGWLWGLEFPIVKKLWTSSYCLFSTGYSAVLLAIFYYIIDVWQVQKWCRPFVWIGLNSITIYLLVELMDFQKAAERLVGGDVMALFNGVAQGLGGLVVALVGLGLAIAVVYFLYCKKIFLRV